MCQLSNFVNRECMMFFSKVRNYTHRCFSSVSISKTKSYNMDKCYFRHIPKEEQVHVTFLFNVKEGNSRQFNLSRKPEETLENLLIRIRTNIQKVLQKVNKKKGAPQNEDLLVNIVDYKQNILPNTLTCIELFSIESKVQLRIIDRVYDILFNAPWVTSISLPNSILAGFPVYPEYFVVDYAEKEYCVFKWYKGMTVNSKGNVISDGHVNWENVGDGFSFTPSCNDIGYKLKLECIPGNKEKVGPSVETISSQNVEAGPGKCPFEYRHAFTSAKLQDRSFRVVTYNILADLYCDSDFTRTELHPYCPPYALQIDYRKQLILKELLGYNADIACLQEVDHKIYKTILTSILGENGFDGVFAKKGKEVAEGLACFYRRDRFRLLSEERIVLAEELKSLPCFEAIWNAVKENEPLSQRVLDRSTVASATILQFIEHPNEILIVGNTHLYFHPDADHIRLIQGGMFIYWLKEILKQQYVRTPEAKVSLVLCGDFNSVPSCGIYQLYTNGIAPSTLPDWKSKENEAVADLTLVQDISLASACGTPEYTNFTAGFADCLDYIFYDKLNLEVQQVIPLPGVEELTAHTAIPSIVFPSDHIALVADLYLK